MYSKIPMPRFEWKEEDASHSLVFFPMVGAVIGGIVLLINSVPALAGLPAAVRILLTILAPIAVTGGFHLDGYMDTGDALSSYADREKKLEIMKDPHIGAFAVISLVKWLLIYSACVTAILLSDECDIETLGIFGLTFVVSRALSGLTSILFTKARKSGMLRQETADKQTGTTVCLIVWLFVAAGLMLRLNVLYAAAVMVSCAVFTMYYRYMSYRNFGGVTGDTAGYFLTALEAVSAAFLAAAIYFL